MRRAPAVPSARILLSGAAVPLLASLVFLGALACGGEGEAPGRGTPRAAEETRAVDEATDREAVREAVDGFKRALAAGDSLGALALLSDSVVVFEGGRAEDKTAYRSGHLAADMAFLSAVPPELVEEALLLEGDWALYTSRSRTVGTFRDRAIDRAGAETLVLVREEGGWRIRHIHWSGGG